MYKKNFEVLFGNWPNGKNGITKPFNENIISFLNQISKKILNNSNLNKFPDLKDFAFWCRKKNIERYKTISDVKTNVIGRGIALHIPPSNVPMNFAFTMAIGLLSGCENIIRIPQKKFEQLDILLKVMNKIISTKKFNFIKNSICVVSYKRSDLKSSLLSKISDVRLIWGGDETVSKFKTYETKLKNIDLYFPDKISGCLLNTNQIKILNDKELKNLVYKFYMDSYLMNQKGCSSPKVIFWYGRNKAIQNRFFFLLEKCIEKKDEYDFSMVNEKIFLLSEIAIKSHLRMTRDNNIKLSIIEPKKKIDKKIFSKLAYGSFFNIHINKLSKMNNYVDENFQTLSFFGFKKKELIDLFISKKFKGIDRVVPIGNAFQMNLIWDGYDVIKYMSRTIS